MRSFEGIGCAILALASVILLFDRPGEAATVRRHLHCMVTSGIVGGLFGSPNPPSFVRITNNWAMTIPKGTLVTYTVERRSNSFKLKSALAQGAYVNLNGPVGGKTAPCDATVPG